MSRIDFSSSQVATPGHVKDKNPQFKSKANILARHCSLQIYLERKFVMNPVFVTLIRQPLDLAISMFYWRHQEKRASQSFGYMRKLRTEIPGSFSEQHLHHIDVWASQSALRREEKPEFAVYSLRPQWNWFGDTLQQALAKILSHHFLVGLVQRMDEFLVMLRERLNLSTRFILSVSVNHYRHPKSRDWPATMVTKLNGTSQLQDDWRFFQAATTIFQRQVEEFGKPRLSREVDVFRTVQGNLKRTCDPQGNEHKAAESFMPRCKPGQPGCKFDATRTIACMLTHYDQCRGGHAVGHGHCDREVAQLHRARAGSHG